MENISKGNVDFLLKFYFENMSIETVNIIRIILTIIQFCFLLGIAFPIISAVVDSLRGEACVDFGDVAIKFLVMSGGILGVNLLKNMLPDKPETPSEKSAFDWSLITSFFQKYAWIFITILIAGIIFGIIFGVVRYRRFIAAQNEIKEREIDEAILHEKLATLTENLKTIYEIQDSKSIPAAIKTQVKQLKTIAIAVKSAIEECPAMVREIRQFLEYHVPTTTTLLTEYHKVRSKPDALQNIPNAQAILSSIESHMDTSVRIYKDVYNEMLQSRVYAVQTEISVNKAVAGKPIKTR
jgi:hypothetical protein